MSEHRDPKQQSTSGQSAGHTTSLSSGQGQLVRQPHASMNPSHNVSSLPYATGLDDDDLESVGYTAGAGQSGSGWYTNTTTGTTMQFLSAPRGSHWQPYVPVPSQSSSSSTATQKAKVPVFEFGKKNQPDVMSWVMGQEPEDKEMEDQ